VRSCASSSVPVTSLRYRAINGTVAPPSSNSTAAATWLPRTPSSSAIRLTMPRAVASAVKGSVGLVAVVCEVTVE
jgi:hypothetical protein